MRMSEWSSDVCSSDLLAKYSPLRAIGSLLHSFSKGGVRGVDAAIRVAVYDLQFSQPLQIALGNQVEAKVDLIPEHDESVAVVQIAAELRQLSLERVCGVVQLCSEIKSPGDRVRPAFQIIRSEEHTSELQLLIPISYAVFCF